MALSASVQAVGRRRCRSWARPWRTPLPCGAVASSPRVCCMRLLSSPCPWTKVSRAVAFGSLPRGWSRGAPLGRRCSFPGRSGRHVRGREVNQMSTPERAGAGTPLRSIPQSSLFLRSSPLRPVAGRAGRQVHTPRQRRLSLAGKISLKITEDENILGKRVLGDVYGRMPLPPRVQPRGPGQIMCGDPGQVGRGAQGALPEPHSPTHRCSGGHASLRAGDASRTGGLKLQHSRESPRALGETGFGTLPSVNLVPGSGVVLELVFLPSSRVRLLLLLAGHSTLMKNIYIGEFY